MRRAWIVGMVVALALALVPPAMALDFKFGGEYRVRFYSYTNAGFTDGAGTAPRGAQVRVRPRFDASDDNGNITATLRLEIGDVEFGNGGGAAGGGAANGYGFGVNVAGSGSARTGAGQGGALGNDGVNVETKWAYIDAAFPFGVPLRVRAGIQPWYLPKGIIVDDDVAGVRFYGTSNPVSYELSWYRTSGGPNTAAPNQTVCVGAAGTAIVTPVAGVCPAGTTAASVLGAAGVVTTTSNTTDNNLDFYNGKVDFSLAKWLNLGLYGGYGRNAATGTAAGGGAVKTWLYYGLSTTGDLGFMRYDFDFVGGRNNGLTPVNGTGTVDASGYGFDAGVHFPIGPAVINVGLSMFTGDKQNGGVSETMPFISPSWNGPGNTMFEMFGAGGVFDPVDLSQDYPGGTWTAGFNVEYRPVKALWMKVGYLYQNFTQNDANCALIAPGSGRCFGPRYGRLAQSVAQRETSLGHEINLRADWDVWTGFKVMGTFGLWIPSAGDTSIEAALQLLYNF